ncbi:hypothetical protein CAEBREN_11304 [Caenorhabditis brenneri]|uniref:Uncharacterized protein n=1 Tax=Caenorhabditis brenneri TaxID=135651 RepID=G0MI44_CAEBE|nr:hypothetical protein CAEBREN_11304 [Caenorhabditis brenneri]
MKISILILFTHFVLVEPRCGSGFVSEVLASLVTTFSSDTYHINRCCRIHDEQYEKIEAGKTWLSRYESDVIFKQCLRNSQSTYTRSVVSNIFYAAVRVNSWVSDKLHSIKCFFLGC